MVTSGMAARRERRRRRRRRWAGVGAAAVVGRVGGRVGTGRERTDEERSRADILVLEFGGEA